ncbi:hypothetical protein I3760_10G012600 [Carya illinoinensis]|nr:hypothetical protein I3760_10G012600 [Carya illinoinensis]
MDPWAAVLRGIKSQKDSLFLLYVQREVKVKVMSTQEPKSNKV